MVGCLPLGGERRWGRREGGLRRSAAAPLSFRTSWPHKSSAPYLFVSSFQSQSFKTKFDHWLSVLIDLVSLVSPAVCNIAEVSWESSQLPQPLQLPPLAPTTSPGLQTLQPWNCRAMCWCFKALGSSPCQVLVQCAQGVADDNVHFLVISQNWVWHKMLRRKKAKYFLLQAKGTHYYPQTDFSPSI